MYSSQHRQMTDYSTGTAGNS